jgi:hypothetical protein
MKLSKRGMDGLSESGTSEVVVSSGEDEHDKGLQGAEALSTVVSRRPNWVSRSG